MLGLLLFSGRRGKKSAGSRLLLVGDSQSVASWSPGRQLAQLLEAAGYRVRVLAVGGKTAAYFAGGKGSQAFAAALAERPAVVLVFLGSNELANVAIGGSEKAQLNGHQRLKDAILQAGARPLFVGPPAFRADVKSAGGGAPLVAAMASLVPKLRTVYGEKNFIDARPYTPDHKGIHFDKKSAKAFALAVGPAVLRTL